MLSPISYVLQRGILLRLENSTYRYRAPVAAVRRGFKMVLFTASRGNTFVGGTCALPSALLVVFNFVLSILYLGKDAARLRLYALYVFIAHTVSQKSLLLDV